MGLFSKKNLLKLASKGVRLAPLPGVVTGTASDFLDKKADKAARKAREKRERRERDSGQ